jgi:hypothetical protein
MKASEFIVEYLLFTAKTKNIKILVSSHVRDRALERNIPWPLVSDMILNITKITPKLEQMLNFEKFYFRDPKNNVDIGARYHANPDHPNGLTRTLFLNTVMNPKDPEYNRSWIKRIIVPSIQTKHIIDPNSLRTATKTVA